MYLVSLKSCILAVALLFLFDNLLTSTSCSSTLNPEFLERLRFKSYAISNLKDPNIDKSQLEFVCSECGKNATRVTKWKYQNRWFWANFKCNCGNKFCGRVSFKKTYDDLIVRRNIGEFKVKKPKPEQTKI